MEVFKNSVRNISHGISKDGLKLTSKIDSEFKLAVDESPNPRKISVCRIAFCRAYGVSHWYLDQLSRRFKIREMEGERDFNDHALGSKSLGEAESIGER